MSLEGESPLRESAAERTRPNAGHRTTSIRASLARSLMLMIFVSAGVILVVTYR